MKKNIFLGIFCFLSLLTYSQKTIPVEIILKNKDTLKGEMKVKTNLFDKQLIYPSSFNGKVIFYNSVGEKTKIKSKEISELTFTDFKGKNRKFIKIKEFKNHIVELIYSNKVRWYKHYYYDSYNHTENTVEELFDENGKQFSIGLFNSYRKKMRKFTKENSNLNEFINNNDMKKNENILKVIKMYEKQI
ncbi:Peptidyl-prolyl cis-trans isomerase ppiD [Tenacibaculum sp. 190524A02b]|uniref:MORN repeat variant n=1 Tax=Tenacibaculum vairaonense TaxID=3137860 RepID=A0ABM9PI47_9FLAO